jgi:hypothetical protein
MAHLGGTKIEPLAGRDSKAVLGGNSRTLHALMTIVRPNYTRGMPVHRCPHCQASAQFEDRTPGIGWRGFNHALKACAACSGLAWVAWGSEVPERLLFPFTPEVSSEIPELVRDPFEEAVGSAQLGHKRAAVLTARASLQAAMREQGAKGKSVKEEIEDLVSKHHIPVTLGDWAHEVRHGGAFAAHPELDATEIAEADVDELVGFCRILFDYLYVMPARLLARKAGEVSRDTLSVDPLGSLQRTAAKIAGKKARSEERAAEDRGPTPTR